MSLSKSLRRLAARFRKSADRWTDFLHFLFAADVGPKGFDLTMFKSKEIIRAIPFAANGHAHVFAGPDLSAFPAFVRLAKDAVKLLEDAKRIPDEPEPDPWWEVVAENHYAGRLMEFVHSLALEKRLGSSLHTKRSNSLKSRRLAPGITVSKLEAFEAVALALKMVAEECSTSEKPNAKEWVRVNKAARIAFVNSGQISRAVTDGDLKGNGKKRRERRVDRQDLTRWIQERVERPERAESDESVKRKMERTNPPSRRSR
jgi:hypothetical protein